MPPLFAPRTPLKTLLAATLALAASFAPISATASVKELIALAKAKPGTLNTAFFGNGSISHLAGELFKAVMTAPLDPLGMLSVSGRNARNAAVTRPSQVELAGPGHEQSQAGVSSRRGCCEPDA